MPTPYDMLMRKPTYRLCALIERGLRAISYIGTHWTVDGPTPPGFTGWRARVLHAGIAFGWLHVSRQSAASHMRFALTGRFHARNA